MPGATPADLEQLVIKPVENALYGIDDLKDVQASATDGAATIQAEFDWSSSAERKYEEVVREVTALRPTLPDGVTRLDVVRNRTSERSEEHTSELQSLMRISYAVFCLKKKK